MNVKDYAKGVERLVDPMAVGKVHYLQTKLKKLPTFLQKKIVTSAARKSSKMPFVVEPYCTFMFFEIEHPEQVEKYLPDGFVLTKSSIFAGDPAKYYGVVTMFRVHTSVFWGARVEYYLIAKNTKTGLFSWIIMDYLSDTISYDEQHGLRSPGVHGGVMTTTCEGEFICDMQDDEKYVHCEASLKDAKMRKLDSRLWIEGNTSIAYGRQVGNSDGDLFSLTFFPEEMSSALEVPTKDVVVGEARTAQTFDARLDRVVSFPYAQHMLSDAPGIHTHYGSEKALREAALAIDFSQIKTLNQK